MSDNHIVGNTIYSSIQLQPRQIYRIMFSCPDGSKQPYSNLKVIDERRATTYLTTLKGFPQDFETIISIIQSALLSKQFSSVSVSFISREDHESERSKSPLSNEFFKDVEANPNPIRGFEIMLLRFQFSTDEVCISIPALTAETTPTKDPLFLQNEFNQVQETIYQVSKKTKKNMAEIEDKLRQEISDLRKEIANLTTRFNGLVEEMAEKV